MLFQFAAYSNQIMLRQHFSETPLFKSIINSVDAICNQYQIDSTHGLPHALKIAALTEKVLLYESVEEQLYEEVICAALLHDLDDRKYFNSKDHENAYAALKTALMEEDRIKRVICMIKLVPFSKNGNIISKQHPPIYYIPRYVDRIEAIGVQGLYRSLMFNLTKAEVDPIFCPATPKPQTEQEAYACSLGRDQQYMRSGKSASVVDHFFDKLIHIKLPKEMKIAYLNEMYNQKNKQMVQFVMMHAANGYQNYQRDLIEQSELNAKQWENIS